MSTRVLVKDGAWQVPPEERPKGWEQLPMREPAAAPLNIIVTVSGVPDILRCGCGRSLHHRGQCHVRLIVSRLEFEHHAKFFRDELVPAILQSGCDFGADKELIDAALVLVAGIYTRKPSQLCDLTGVSWHKVKSLSERLVRKKLWKPECQVVLGEIDDKYGDVELWLIAMAAAGRIGVQWHQDGRLLFYGLKGRTAEGRKAR